MQNNNSRPLSPHLGIYKPQITSVLSITHRITGAALSFGTILLVAWLWGAAYDAEFYETLRSWVITPVGKALLVCWTLAFYFHLANGIRHLFWDVGLGFELKTVTWSGMLVLVLTIVLTAATWWKICNSAGVVEL